MFNIVHFIHYIGVSALLLAAGNGHVDVVLSLLQCRATVNLKTTVSFNVRMKTINNIDSLSEVKYLKRNNYYRVKMKLGASATIKYFHVKNMK